MVIGNGGYHNLHHLPKEYSDATANGEKPADIQDDETGAKLIYGDDRRFGYVTLTVTRDKITGTQTAVDYKTGTVTKNADTFSYTTKPLHLGNSGIVSL